MKLGMQVGLGPGHILLDGDPAPPPQMGRNPRIFIPYLLWPNGWMYQDATCHGGKPQPKRHCVRRRPSYATPKRGRSPQFLSHICGGQMVGWKKMPLGREVGLSPSGIVLDRDPAPLPEREQSLPQFSANVYCGQTAGWIKMPLGMEVGLSPSDIVLDGDPISPSPKGGGARQFSAHICCEQMAGWIKMALGTEVGLGPATLC